MRWPRPRIPTVRLWVKLAALAALGVIVTHAAHLVLTNRAATRTLLAQQATIGATLARVVADQAADPLLVNDLVTLHELAARATADAAAVRYLIVLRRGEVVASSFQGPTPPALVALRADGSRDPLVVSAGGVRTLDLVEPVLGDVGEVRVGLDMRSVQRARRGIAARLGLIALAVIAAGLAAALVVGRSVGGPVQEMLDAADRFDPAAGEVPAVRPRGSREIATLAERFDRMMRRLRAAHVEGVRARQKAVETERMVALGSLVAGVAHEVNNPLAGLKNCVRRLERSELPEEKRREYLALMEEGLVRIEEVMKRLLDFGRPHPPRLQPLSAAALAEDASALLRPLLERRRVRAPVLAAAGDAAVLADRRLAGQALVNLLLNAAYVTADGGEVRLRVRRRPGFAGIAVEDDGPGIPPEARERILDPFFSTKPEGEGTGLGLSVTRTIVDAHGGELAFEFPAAGGTVATVWLRDAASAAPAGEAR